MLPAGKRLFIKRTVLLPTSPLPLALAHIVGNNNALYHLLITVGLFGLVASFHGIILASGRSVLEFGRVKFAPGFVGEVHSKFKTPANALLINMLIGIIALLTGKTSEIIAISVFGALTLYIISMISLLQLRKKEPEMPRPFKVPMYPVLPVVALIIATISLVAMTIFNFHLALIYFVLLGICYVAFKMLKK